MKICGEGVRDASFCEPFESKSRVRLAGSENWIRSPVNDPHAWRQRNRGGSAFRKFQRSGIGDIFDADHERHRGGIDVARVAIVSTRDERAEAVRDLLDVLESPAARDEPIYVFGAGTAGAFDALAEELALEPARAGDLAGRFVDLAPWLRRTVVLPVFLYRFDEVAAVARNLPRPSAGQAEDALFVLHAGLAASEDPAAVRRNLEAAGRDALESLRAIRAWFTA